MKKLGRFFLFILQILGLMSLVLAIFCIITMKTVAFSNLIPPCFFFFTGVFLWAGVTFRKSISRFLKKHKFLKAVYIVFSTLSYCFIIFIVSLSIFTFSTGKISGDAKNLPAVVLGSYVINDKPGAQLTERLNAAVEYLNDNPSAICITTGGLSEGCTLPQGTIMKNYLIANGIDAARIYAENEAYDTDENMKYSKEILDSLGMSNDIALVTSEYHQYRSSLRAEKHGLNPHNVPSKTAYWWHLPHAVVREAFGVIEFWFFG